MNCSCANSVFKKTLHYASPAHGGWGVLKAAQLLPESYHLFVSPEGCGRHGALAACLDDRKKRVSYMFLKEEDIVSGGYEDALIQAVKELLEHLGKCNRTPKVLAIFVSCIDDLLGTDHQALIDKLSEIYPEIKFMFCQMNPTSMDTSVPPAVNVQDKNYRMLNISDVKDKGANLIGNFAPIRPNSELFNMLKEIGFTSVRHISDYQTFHEYQDMAKSCLNIVVAPSGKYSAINMRKKHNIPFQTLFTTFQKSKIRENYEILANYMNVDCPDTDLYEQKLDDSLHKTKEKLCGMPVLISGESIVRPFDLAKALLEAGINVACIYQQELLPSDKENFEWLIQNFPHVKILQPQNIEASLREQLYDTSLAIGYSAAYQSRSRHVVDIDGQHGLYGYQGMMDLLAMMRKASEVEIDLKKVLDEAVLVV